MSVSDLGEALGSGIQDKDNIKPQLGERPKIFTYTRSRDERLDVLELTAKVETKNIAGGAGIYGSSDYGIFGIAQYGSTDGMIWGSAVHGVWDTAKWGPFTVGFILGSNVLGLLGTNKLGTGNASVFVLTRAVNPSDTYQEFFSTTDFKHSDTTADWDTTNGLCAFDADEILVTEIFARNDETYTQATITITGANTTDLTFEVQFDGSNWETIANEATLIVANPSDFGIKFRATAAASLTENVFPLAFPFTFGTAITHIKVVYST